jgi:hypothetical protein
VARRPRCLNDHRASMRLSSTPTNVEVNPDLCAVVAYPQPMAASAESILTPRPMLLLLIPLAWLAVTTLVVAACQVSARAESVSPTYDDVPDYADHPRLTTTMV